MKSYNWSMGVLEAEALRAERTDLKDRIKELANQRAEAASRSDKIRLTKERRAIEEDVKRIDEQLEGAPPRPMEERVVVKELLAELNGMRKRHFEVKRQFVRQFELDPAHAMKWDAEELLVSRVKAGLVSRVLKYVVKEQGLNTLEDVLAVGKLIKEQAERESRHYDPLHNSTSMLSNVVEACEFKACRELLGGSFGSVECVLAKAEWVAEHVAAYKAMLEEMSE